MTDTGEQLPDITDSELLERAVKNCRAYRGWHTRWAAVALTFGLGSTYSRRLCARFGLDPEERVKR